MNNENKIEKYSTEGTVIKVLLSQYQFCLAELMAWKILSRAVWLVFILAVWFVPAFSGDRFTFTILVSAAFMFLSHMLIDHLKNQSVLLRKLLIQYDNSTVIDKYIKQINARDPSTLKDPTNYVTHFVYANEYFFWWMLFVGSEIIQRVK